MTNHLHINMLNTIYMILNIMKINFYCYFLWEFQKLNLKEDMI